jgi:type VI protein secretion system component VasK
MKGWSSGSLVSSLRSRASTRSSRATTSSGSLVGVAVVLGTTLWTLWTTQRENRRREEALQQMLQEERRVAVTEREMLLNRAMTHNWSEYQGVTAGLTIPGSPSGPEVPWDTGMSDGEELRRERDMARDIADQQELGEIVVDLGGDFADAFRLG